MDPRDQNGNNAIYFNPLYDSPSDTGVITSTTNENDRLQTVIEAVAPGTPTRSPDT